MTSLILNWPPQIDPLPTRPQVAARAHVLRNALDLLADQSDRDGHGRYQCVGAMKVELIRLEGDLRQIDAPTTLGAQLEAELRQVGGGR